MESLSKKPTGSDLIKLVNLAQKTDENINTMFMKLLEFAGKETTYGKRIIKKYKDTFWNFTAKLSDNNKKAEAMPYAKKIYKYCSKEEKMVLRNVYGYKNMGASESDLTSEELNSLAIEHSEKGHNKKAVELFTKAAEKGSRDAQHNLGVVYLNGKEAPKDLYLAEKWLLKAAQQGDVGSMSLLAVLYAEKNDGENSKKWLIKAASLGNEAALEIAKDWISKGIITQYDINRYGN